MMTCQRRFDDFAYGYGIENKDSWIQRSGKQYCSYCGSLSSEDFFKLAESCAKITPTDKSYKVYIENDKLYFQHLSENDKAKFVDLLNAYKLNIAYPFYFYTLPYFVNFQNGRFSLKSVK